MAGSAAAFTQSKSSSNALNTWVLHLQKLGLELKCPLCLRFFDRPTLLPCDHIVCKNCLPSSAEFPVPCPQCQSPCSLCDLRPAPYMENMVTIYKRMNTTFHSSLSWNAASIGVASVPHNCEAAPNRDIAENPVNIARDGHREGKELVLSGGFGNSNSLRGNLGAGKTANGGTVEIDMNQLDNSSQGSPPLSGSKSLDDDSSDQGSGQTPVKHSVKRSVVSVNTERHLSHSKKQKKFSSRNPELGSDAGIDKSGSSKTGSELESPSPPSQLADDTRKSSPSSFLCAFCSSSTSSEASGEMLHYVDGNPVEGDDKDNPNAIHVHRKCIEWAPQVYFVGDTVKNLEKELARGAKLKCGRCGLKGAALGCYVKSCRMTYHAPCAAEVSGCRWDCDNFVMLCPSHASVRFPGEKSKIRSSKLASSAPPQKSSDRRSDFWHDSHDKAKSWVLCGSSLSPEDKFLLGKFATMIGAAGVSKSWSPEVTHVVAATDAEGACTRSFKVLMAILHGRWILNMNWIKACMEAMSPVDEEPYEVGLDNHGSSGGPKLGRLRALNNDPKLFNGLKFYLAGDFVPAFTRDLRILVTAGGGKVLKGKESLTEEACDNEEASSRLIVFNPEPPEGVQLGEEVSIYWQKINEAEELAASSGSKVISYTWVLESVAACRLQPFVDLSSHFAC